MSNPARARKRTVNRKSTSVNRSLKHFTDLDAWKVNHELALQIYKLTKKWPKEERFGLIDQIRRAVVSVTNNIAEGWGRFHYADKNSFFYRARGSNAEVQNLLIIARDLRYITDSEFKELYAQAQKGFQIISGLVRSIQSRKP